MATREKSEAPAAEDTGRGRERGAAIAGAVLRLLGHPAGLRGVDVRPLWDNHYRANVLIGPDPTSIKIAHSFFLEADREGVILKSTPALTREYGVEGGSPG
jgi:hypothetical protein